MSGIKAARMMIEKYPDAFFKDKCEPHVPVSSKHLSTEVIVWPTEFLARPIF